MGRRFAIVVGVAAAGVMALGAQTAAAAPGVVKYDTELTIAKGSSGRLYHGRVLSEVRECMSGRRVVLIKQRPGADRKLGTSRSQWGDGEAHWRVVIPQTGARVYAKVRPKVSDRFVCRADRSATIGHPRSLGSQAATSSTVEPVDRTPPDIQLSGPKKQELGNAVKVKSSCGDEACQTGTHGGKLTNLRVTDQPLAGGEPMGPFLKNLKPARESKRNADLGPGETATLKFQLGRKTRKLAGKALDKGRNVQAKVIIDATDAAGNQALAKRTITLVK